MYCDICEREIKDCFFNHHLKSNTHKRCLSEYRELLKKPKKKKEKVPDIQFIEGTIILAFDN